MTHRAASRFSRAPGSSRSDRRSAPAVRRVRVVALSLTVALIATTAAISPIAASPGALALTPGTGSVDTLLAAMTLDEKIGFVHGSSDPASLGQAGYIPGVARLGVPPLRLTDGPAGVRVTQPSTAMPAPVALASSFDPGLARQYGEIIGRNGRALGQDVLLSPMVNTIRVPYAGRNFETFSEDPLLSAKTVAGEVRGIQSQGLIATTKHYAENNQEQDRQTVDVRVGDQALHEIELAGFEAAVKAGTGSIMCSYNQINGETGCGNTELLTTILKEQWGFRGWVMSDWGATHSTDAISAGLDQEMPGGTYLGTPLKSAIENGSLPVGHLNASVRRILDQMAVFGLLKCASPAGAVAGCQLPARPSFGTGVSNAVAQKVAEQGAVLLRNTDRALPLTGRTARDIALIGTPAQTPVIGGGGSSQVTPTSVTTPRAEITARAGTRATVTYSPGIDTTGVVIPAEALSGGPIDLTGAQALPNGQNFDQTRTLTVPSTGDYLLNLSVAQGIGALTVDGTQVASGFALSSQLTSFRATVHLTAGPHRVRVSALGIPGFLTGPLQVRLSWVTPQAAQATLAEAVAQARTASTAVVFGYDEGTEGADRTSLALPFGQDALISAVAASNPNTVVVLNTGSAITMPWLGSVKSVLDLYYPGQMGGRATARLLFGDVNPSGKLSQTFPLDESHTPVAGDPARYPGVDGEEQYSEGIFVGYRWYDAEHQKALFPFGYGLSYSSFGYRNLHARPARGGGLSVTFTVHNTGRRAGSEVAQVYLGPSSRVTGAQQAVRALVGYDKVYLRPGQSRTITVKVARRQLQHWDSTASGWRLGTGVRTVWAGSSSRTLPLSTAVRVSS
jgi:beta-glucosidase